MITLRNWYQQQPEVVYFVQTNFQGDEFMKKLVRSEMSKQQWDKMVDRYSDCEIYKVITENHRCAGTFPGTPEHAKNHLECILEKGTYRGEVSTRRGGFSQARFIELETTYCSYIKKGSADHSAEPFSEYVV